jgi:hypothetical protein
LAVGLPLAACAHKGRSAAPGGTLSVPFDGPPNHAYVPRCDAAGKASTLQVLSLAAR